MIEYPTKRVPIFIGKPEPTMVNYVMGKYYRFKIDMSHINKK